MLKGFGDIFRIPDLRKKILFTFGIVIVYRIGAFIPTPGVDAGALKTFFESQKGTLIGFFDLFSGGALSKLSIFSMGIMPYINASIIMSLLQTVVPFLEQLAKEGASGRKKLNQYTRIGTLVLAAVQSYGLTFWMQSMKVGGISVVKDPGLGFQLLTVLTLTTGTVFIMWLGEQITERGIGNGISILIFAGIIDRIPAVIFDTWQLFKSGEMSLLTVVALIAVIVILIGFVTFIQQAQRKIPVQYAKRIVGRRMYGGQSSYLPLRVDQSGVIAVIFAVSIMMFPATIGQFFPNNVFFKHVTEWFTRGGYIYNIVYALLIIFFCYFYTAITFNPGDLADNMKKQGGFIPGIRPGPPTSEYIDKVLTRITLIGAVFVVFIAIIPDYIFAGLHAEFWSRILSGTSILIVVGVALDTMGQVESHLLMRHYEGFMKKAHLKGRMS